MQMSPWWVIVVFSVGALVWMVRRSNRGQGTLRAVLTKNEARAGPYPYIYVNADGSARELHPSERNYLETPFHPVDGGRPYVKDSYLQKNGWGEIAGFLRRARLPHGTVILAAPEAEPSRLRAKEDQLQFLRSKGMDVVDNGDGSFTVTRPKR